MKEETKDFFFELKDMAFVLSAFKFIYKIECYTNCNLQLVYYFAPKFML